MNVQVQSVRAPFAARRLVMADALYRRLVDGVHAFLPEPADSSGLGSFRLAVAIALVALPLVLMFDVSSLWYSLRHQRRLQIGLEHIEAPIRSLSHRPKRDPGTGA